MKQTEPIGFKGTQGEFLFTKHNGSFVIHLKDDTTICDVWQDELSCSQKEADTKIMTSSKNMAIALQNLLALLSETDYSDIFPDSITQAEEALKQAGL